MRIIRIVDVISNSDDTNPDSEPCVAVNPINPQEIVATSFTPAATGPNGAVFVSTDGGEHWTERDSVSGGGSLDQTVSFGATSGRLYMATILTDFSLAIESTPDPTSGTTFSQLKTYADTRSTVKDQPWIVATTVTSGPDKGQDRLYVGYNDISKSLGATVNICFDATNANPVFTPVLLDSRSGTHSPQDGAPVRCAVHQDGTVYAGFQGLKSFDAAGNATVDFIMTRDDNWGRNNFTDLIDKSDNKSGRIVASGVVGESSDIGTERPTFTGSDVNVDPNNSNVVYMCWHDDVGAAKTQTIHVRRSLNRGVDWSGDLITVSNAVLAEMAINSAGTVGLLYQQFVNSLWETHFQTTTDGSNWDDLLLARTAQPPDTGDPTLGDFFRLLAVGPHFYGIFPSVNTPGTANFLPNGEGTVSFLRKVNSTGDALVGSDGVSTVTPSVDPFFFKVEEKNVIFQLNRNPLSQDEAIARKGAPITDALRVIVDGFTATELGIQGPSDQLAVTVPIAGMTATCTGNVADTGTWGSQIQRFTFTYDISFDGLGAFNFASPSQDVTLSATAGTGPSTVTNSAVLTLIKSPDPFILHGDTSWLSIDLRVFSVFAGQQFFSGHPWQVSDAAGCPEYIQTVMKFISPDDFDNELTTSEDFSRLFTQSTDGLGHEVFNFALAKVHYIGTNPDPFDVRMFFRLFQAQTTTGQYDFTAGQPASQSGQYRRGINGDNEAIPLAGFLNGEYVTIPFFASPRINSEVASMTTQTDPPNIQTITPRTDGGEVIKFYGCWLDFNQPTRTDINGLVVQNNVLPVHVPANVDGPFTTGAVPIQSLVRATHHCLIAEIDYTPTPIPLGKDPSNWDKLAQRNITYSDAGSATAVTTFDIKPSIPSSPQIAQDLDAIVIDWGKTRANVRAEIYLPEIDISEVLTLASRQYFPTTNLSRVDDHTLGCRVGGITYIPIPVAQSEANLAGLISIDMPDNLHVGEVFDVVVRQVTNRSARRQIVPKILRPTQTIVSDPDAIIWRQVAGAFQLTIPVGKKSALLARESNDLAFLRYVARSIPKTSRWYLVFRRYLQIVAGRVRSFGGDPSAIPPSATGSIECGDNDNDECCQCCKQQHHHSCKNFTPCEEHGGYGFGFGFELDWHLGSLKKWMDQL